jgi:hypothetical protein
MSKRVLVSILLLPAIVVAFGLATRPNELLNFILGPIDDPRYFCGAPDPSPVADLGSSTVLQECSAGKAMTIRRGETIAVALQNNYGVDRYSDWHDFNVSNESVLRTVVAPSARHQVSATGAGISRVVYTRNDEIAVYRALKAGESIISAVQVACGATGGCDRDHRWNVTVDVN